MKGAKQKLVGELQTRGLNDLAERAEAGEFSDFASPHPLPVMVLVRELKLAGAADLADRAKQGDFDHDH